MIRRVLIFLLVVYWAVIFTLTHLPPMHLPQTGAGDKLAHFIGYFGLATLLYLVFWWSKHVRHPALLTLAICAAYGAVDELLQIPVGRNADIMDWVADMAGATTAVTMMVILRSMVSAWTRRKTTQPVQSRPATS